MDSWDNRGQERDQRDGVDGQGDGADDAAISGTRSAGEATMVRKLVQFSSGLSKPFIQRPVMTMLLTTSIIVFGILTYNQLAVNDLPAVDYPIIQVSANYPGANPETMANTIATPLEKQFTQIPGITMTTSSSTQGSTNITLSSTSRRASTPLPPMCRRPSNARPVNCPPICRARPRLPKVIQTISP